jgi:hypothetical protein
MGKVRRKNSSYPVSAEKQARDGSQEHDPPYHQGTDAECMCFGGEVDLGLGRLIGGWSYLILIPPHYFVKIIEVESFAIGSQEGTVINASGKIT